MGAHAEDALDDGRSPLGGPHIAGEALGFGATRQQGGQLCPLGIGQVAAGAGRWMAIQRRGAARAGAAEPLADRAPGHTQGRRDGCPFPALLVQRQRPRPPAFPPIPW